MQFSPTAVHGAFLIEAERFEDERGFLARAFCEREFAAHGLNPHVAQCNISYNRLAGTLRGLHLQQAPHAEAKLVRCTAGALFDVIVDLRAASPTFGRHFSIELSAVNRTMIYAPAGCAHGFQTLQDDTEVFYQMAVAHAPDAAAGVRWNDPAFGIAWPLAVTVISERDRGLPDFHADDPRWEALT